MKRVLAFVVSGILLGCGGPAELAEQTPPPVTGAGTVMAPDGVPIAYTVTGGGSPALVLVHGWMCNQSFWAEQVDEFASSHTVVALDLPGHGQSGMVRMGWPILAYGADVKAVVEHLGLEEIIVIGHSMGGPVALEAARLMPERVIGVVAVDSLQDADATYDPGQMEAMIAAFRNDFAGACSEFVTAMFQKGADPDLVERVRTDMCGGTPEIGAALMAEYVDYDMAAALAAINVPVRCINAGMWPTNIEANRKYHENFDAVIIEGVGHFLMMEKPEEFNSVLSKVVADLDQTVE